MTAARRRSSCSPSTPCSASACPGSDERTNLRGRDKVGGWFLRAGDGFRHVHERQPQHGRQLRRRCDRDAPGRAADARRGELPRRERRRSSRSSSSRTRPTALVAAALRSLPSQFPSPRSRASFRSSPPVGSSASRHLARRSPRQPLHSPASQPRPPRRARLGARRRRAPGRRCDSARRPRSVGARVGEDDDRGQRHGAIARQRSERPRVSPPARRVVAIGSCAAGRRSRAAARMRRRRARYDLRHRRGVGAADATPRAPSPARATDRRRASSRSADASAPACSGRSAGSWARHAAMTAARAGSTPVERPAARRAAPRRGRPASWPRTAGGR